MTRLPALLPLILLCAYGIHAESQGQNCKVHFSVVRKDNLNNIQQGLINDDLKWMETKMAQKYPDVCYVPPEPSIPIVFYISISRDTYHGTRTVTNTASTQGTTQGTVTDDTVGSPTYGQQVGTTSGTVSGTTTSNQEVPYSFPYTILTLSVETPEPNGSWKVRRNFQNNTIHTQVYGIAVNNRHPYHSLIEQAMKWLHDGGLDDPKQAVLPPATNSEKSAAVSPVGTAAIPSAVSAPAKLSVSSTPEGADIELDGNFVGNTPSELSIAEGEHTVLVKKAGFKPWERKLKTTPGSTIHINAELEISPE